ncbi:hypothetical protein Mame01_49980 [Microbispora amethystogenes]|nr:hypothetical protein Mame01_49980 [Microbispora amethystogenes]
MRHSVRVTGRAWGIALPRQAPAAGGDAASPDSTASPGAASPGRTGPPETPDPVRKTGTPFARAYLYDIAWEGDTFLARSPVLLDHPMSPGEFTGSPPARYGPDGARRGAPDPGLVHRAR